MLPKRSSRPIIGWNLHVTSLYFTLFYIFSPDDDALGLKNVAIIQLNTIFTTQNICVVCINSNVLANICFKS